MKQLSLYPNEAECALFERVKRDLGVRSNGEVLRIALRTLAEQRQIQDAPRTPRTPRTRRKAA